MRRALLGAIRLLLTVLWGGWLAVATAGEPALVLQAASHLAGVELGDTSSNAPDDDDETDPGDVALAAVAHRRACRRGTPPVAPAGYPALTSSTASTAPVLAPTSSTRAATVPSGAGVFLRC